jgi:hypothetical protein
MHEAALEMQRRIVASDQWKALVASGQAPPHLLEAAARLSQS